MDAQPGALPLLQYALTELFANRRNGMMARHAYAEIGGVLGAMTRRAEDLFHALSPDQQAFSHQLFLRLVTLGEGVEDTRRRVGLSELQHLARGLGGTVEILSPVLDAFGNARLLTFDHDPATREPTVEVAHEALLRKWDRLRAWLDASRNDLRLQRLLAAAATDWENADHDESFLLHGARLSQYETWQQDTKLVLMPQERTFLEASLAAQTQKEQEEVTRYQRELEAAQQLATSEQQRAQVQAQAATRLRQRAYWLATAFLISAILGIFAWFARQQAVTNEALAERSSVVSQSLALASGAQAAKANNNNDLALSLAYAANQIADPPVFSQQVLYDVALQPGTVRQIEGGGGWRWAMDVYLKSHLVASGADDQIVIVWDYTTGKEIQRLVGQHTDSIGSVVFTPDGQYLLSGAYDDWMVLWDVQTGVPVRRMFNPTGDVNGLAISPDGRTALAGTELGVATYWDLQTGEQLGTWMHNPDVQVLPVTFRADGKLAATGAEDGSVILWDVLTQQPIRTLQVFEDVIFGLDFSPDGKRLAVSGKSDTIRLYEVETGQLVGTLSGLPDWVFDMDFSPDGTQLLVGMRDGAVMLWHVADQQLLLTMYGKEGRTLSVAFLDADTAISSTSTGDLRLWSLADDRLQQTLAVGDFLVSMAQSTDVQMVAFGLQGIIKLHDLSGKLLRQIEAGEGEVTALAFSPDGTMLLSATQGGPAHPFLISLRLWDVQTGV
ncbi:MAG TPA: WD40 repeat domain-containing protein, partial [Anaerolineales bacterium]|nr:WD40 repeat domain-containing protein [Anaerolineales bacterium]